MTSSNNTAAGTVAAAGAPHVTAPVVGTHAPDAERALVFFDIDGTLVGSRDFSKIRQQDGSVTKPQTAPGARPAPSSRVQAAFQSFHERGHLAFVCTGRPKGFIQQSVLDLGFDGFICLAGAYVEVAGTVVQQAVIEHELLEQVARRMFAAGLDVDDEGAGGNCSLYPVHAAVMRTPLMRTADELFAFEREHGPFSKFCLRGDQSAALAPVLPWLLEHFDTADMGMGIREFALKGVNKRTGIERVLGTLGHGRANTFAFGDSENDLPMADAVETFVAMGNAFDHVKAEAAYVTGSLAKDGVATGLAHFGLADAV